MGMYRVFVSVLSLTKNVSFNVKNASNFFFVVVLILNMYI